MERRGSVSLCFPKGLSLGSGLIGHVTRYKRLLVEDLQLASVQFQAEDRAYWTTLVVLQIHQRHF
ncbi:hypothetical protein CHLRE_03g143747v5 [Chlamydomonas reinhardtii]|uniref:Uncharacterized protein n=1 Tax=Chlamydomonas reinhardtii TaxID=3055 RepID=A0A2K3DV18_CHLRE|nr:uncharacterized protein CHLRE_03g143747v5 [Chlamydomonas reinhardtii]PNW84375.1 hypothetical protein CHLRE_03g143747v5 [Chlamydomonas reinhardtii]